MTVACAVLSVVVYFVAATLYRLQHCLEWVMRV